MPRNPGTGVYNIPVGTDAVTNTTIASSPYNSFIHDVETDLNTPRPIVAGGTGATSADDALTNLSGEKSTQIITNYDAALWIPGSFRSAAGATGAPVAGHAFAGICYIGEALATPPTNQNVVVEARDLDDLTQPGVLYTRQKKAGTWSPWDLTSTANQQESTRQAIYAAPFDALAYNGMQFNGSMNVSQENSIGSILPLVIGAPKYIVDGFGGLIAGATVGANISVVTLNALAGFSNCIQIACTTATTLVGASDGQSLYHPIEGYRWSRLGFGNGWAQPLTIGFWVNPGMSGTMAVAVKGGATLRSYVVDVPVTANIWQYKTVTIPGDTSVQVWGTTNNFGAVVHFCFGAGSGRKTTANTWVTGDFIATAATTNFFAATGTSTVSLTGVVVLPGNEAPSSARSPYIMRPYDQELVTCRRYFQWNGGVNDVGFFAFNNQNFFGTYKFTPGMRAVPTITLYNAATANQVSVVGGSPATPNNGFGATVDGFGSFQTTASIGTGNTVFFNVKADIRL